VDAAIALLSRGHHPGASRGTLLTLVFRHVQAKHTPRRVKLRNGRSGTYADVTFFMLDDEYTAMGLLPERDSSERALILFNCLQNGPGPECGARACILTCFRCSDGFARLDFADCVSLQEGCGSLLIAETEGSSWGAAGRFSGVKASRLVVT
jgi:hypothetical protein